MYKAGKTSRDITGSWFGHEAMTIPKGTPVNNVCAGGHLADGHFFVSGLSWVPRWEDGTRKSGFLHDATYYGVSVASTDVDISQ